MKKETVEIIKEIRAEIINSSLYMNGVSIGGMPEKVVFLNDALQVIDKALKEQNE